MSSTYAIETHPIVLELYSLLREMDPARWTEGKAAALRERLEHIRARLEALRSLSSPDEGLARLQSLVAEIERLLVGHVAQASARAAATREEWMALGARLRPAYDALALALKAEDIHVPSLRPTNYGRNLVHAASGFVALAIILLVPSPGWMTWLAGAFFVYAWTMEFVRRRSKSFNDRLMAFYGPVAHPHEWHRVNSATWYCTALLALALTGSPVVCSVAVLVLGIGDPSAALVGRRWGRIRTLNGRSLEGSLTFVATATAVAFAALALFFGSIPLDSAALLAFAGATGGAIAETLSRRIDDNLTIPVAAGATVWAVLALIG